MAAGVCRGHSGDSVCVCVSMCECTVWSVLTGKYEGHGFVGLVGRRGRKRRKTMRKSDRMCQISDTFSIWKHECLAPIKKATVHCSKVLRKNQCGLSTKTTYKQEWECWNPRLEIHTVCIIAGNITESSSSTVWRNEVSFPRRDKTQTTLCGCVKCWHATVCSHLQC